MFCMLACAGAAVPSVHFEDVPPLAPEHAGDARIRQSVERMQVGWLGWLAGLVVGCVGRYRTSNWVELTWLP